ncbi:MAG: hypothetical protein KF819_18265 [Labilithrix sp.]|nr:hypothetical protein [Labilithrix sp.]
MRGRLRATKRLREVHRRRYGGCGAEPVTTLVIFIATLALILAPPRGSSAGGWAALGAAAMIALGLVTPAQALEMVWLSRNVISFLLALLLLSALVESSGFFEWAALHASRNARGDGRRLFRNVFVLGALVTTTLSLDTTAVMLTPIVVAFVQRLHLPGRPYVIATAFVANVASLTLPISNLTNLLFADAFGIPFARFALHMAAPQIVAATATYHLLRWRFRDEIPASFDPESLPAPASVVGDAPYFRVAAIVLGLVLVGYFVTPAFGVEPYVVAFGGAFVLAIIGVRRRRVGVRTLREISWGLFPLVLGLFVVVRGVENLGFVASASRSFADAAGDSTSRVLFAAGAAAAASNVMNNLPAALLARSILHGPIDHAGVFGALVGLDIGPTILPTGSLATLLVLDIARKKGERVRGVEIVKTGCWLTPIVLLLTALTLGLLHATVKGESDAAPTSAKTLRSHAPSESKMWVDVRDTNCRDSPPDAGSSVHEPLLRVRLRRHLLSRDRGLRRVPGSSRSLRVRERSAARGRREGARRLVRVPRGRHRSARDALHRRPRRRRADHRRREAHVLARDREGSPAALQLRRPAHRRDERRQRGHRPRARRRREPRGAHGLRRQAGGRAGRAARAALISLRADGVHRERRRRRARLEEGDHRVLFRGRLRSARAGERAVRGVHAPLLVARVERLRAVRHPRLLGAEERARRVERDARLALVGHVRAKARDLLVREAEQELFEGEELLLGDVVSAEVVEQPPVARLLEEDEHLVRPEQRAEDGQELRSRGPRRLEDGREVVDLDEEALLPDAKEKARSARLHARRRVRVGDDRDEQLLGELGVDRLRDLALDGRAKLLGRADGLEHVADGLEQVDLRDEVRLSEDRLRRNVEIDVVVGDATELIDERLHRERPPRAAAPRRRERRRVANELGGLSQAGDHAVEDLARLRIDLPDRGERSLDEAPLCGVEEEPLFVMRCAHRGSSYQHPFRGPTQVSARRRSPSSS